MLLNPQLMLYTAPGRVGTQKKSLNEANMTISIYTASVPAFVQSLEALSAILAKAGDFCAARKIDPAVMCATRLIPDMLPLSRQVMIACDHAKNGSSRIAAVEAPKFEDTEKTIDELRERVAKTIDYIKTIDRSALEAAPGREIRFSIGPNPMKMEAVAYLTHFVLPNFYFHYTTAYAILRSSGVDVGKRDFIGTPPGLQPA